MGKSSKKSATKVDAAPAVVASPTKPVKKGKREPEKAVEKQVATKKQKKNDGTALKQAIVKQKTETKTQKKSKKKEESSSSDEESEEETKPAAKKPVKQPSDSSSGEDSSSSDEDVTEKPAGPAKNGTVGKPATKGKPAGSSDDSDSESEGEESEDDEPKKASAKNVHAPAVAKNGSVAAKKKDESSDDSADGSSSDEDSDEDEAPAPKGARSKKPTPTTAAKQKVDTEEADSEEENSSESESSDEESSEGEEKVSKTPKKKDADVEMVDADSAKTKKASQTPQTPQAQATGSKTLFMGNLSFSIEKTDVEDFFKDAGEITDVRFATDRDGAFKGFGHVEFATVEAAQKALELHGQQLLGRQIKLDLARERGAYTPSNGNANSYQKGGRAQGQSIFVRGFDANDGEEKIRSTLEEYFGSCGTISRVSIPTDYESGAVKGIAYMDFSDSDGVNKALALDGSEIAKGSFLTVQEAKPRGDSFGSGGRSGGDRSGGRFGRGGGRGFGGRTGGRGGRFSGGDSGGFGGRHGDRGGRGGRGGPNRSSMTAAGKKTTFDD